MENGKTREGMYNSLLRKIAELGREPSFEEVKMDISMPDPNDYAYYFGSFSNALHEAWGEYNFNRMRNERRGHAHISVKKPISLPTNGVKL